MCDCNTTLKVKIKRVRDNGQEKLPLPSYQTEDSCGMDVYSADPTFTLLPGESSLIHTGIAIAMPRGYRLEVCARSGLALKYVISLVNGPGQVDADYRGEVGVIAINHGKEPFVVKYGERIAQIVFSRYERAEWIEVDELGETERGAGGFGHTGR